MAGEVTRAIRLSMIAMAAILAIACGGQPRDLGTISHHDPEFDIEAEWTIVEVEGVTLAPAAVPAVLVEVDADGRNATVFFRGGRPSCYTAAGVTIERHDPELPTATVLYGLRVGNFGCTADLWYLAIRAGLEPPFKPQN